MKYTKNLIGLLILLVISTPHLEGIKRTTASSVSPQANSLQDNDIPQKAKSSPKRSTPQRKSTPQKRNVPAKQSAPQRNLVNASQPLKIGNTQITIVKGDITQQRVDAIVNAVNEDLIHRGGVAASISRAAGPKLQQYSNAMPAMANGKKCPTGQAVITPAFNLEKIGIKNIIHATGPQGSDPDRQQLLRDAYQNSLQVAENKGLKTVAFPAISTAIFGYDINQATPVAFAAVRDFIKRHPNAIDEVRFVLFSDKDLAVYQKFASDLLK